MPVLRARDVEAALRKGGPANVAIEVPARFKAGDEVIVRNRNPPGHTRAPRYVRGRAGLIERDYGVFIFPDTHAMGRGQKPQHLYSVRFTDRALWGPEAPAKDMIYVDLWDDYLDPA